MAPEDRAVMPETEDAVYLGPDSLIQALREALARLGSQEPDPDTLQILGHAARLIPEAGQPPEISTTRLFAGVMALGSGSAENSYPGAVYSAR